MFGRDSKFFEGFPPSLERHKFRVCNGFQFYDLIEKRQELLWGFSLGAERRKASFWRVDNLCLCCVVRTYPVRSFTHLYKYCVPIWIQYSSKGKEVSQFSRLPNSLTFSLFRSTPTKIYIWTTTQPDRDAVARTGTVAASIESTSENNYKPTTPKADNNLVVPTSYNRDPPAPPHIHLVWFIKAEEW